MAKLLLLLLFAWLAWRLLRPARQLPPRLSFDEQEARQVLGVGPGAGAEAIRAAHRRLLTAVHPDRGGSAELTKRINAARDVLLRR